MLLNPIAALIRGLFRLAITPVKTNPGVMSNIEQDGALVPNSAIVPALQAFAANASPVFGNWSQTIIPSSLAAATYAAAGLVGGIIRRFNSGSAFATDSTDTATNIINAIPGAVVNQTFPLLLANLGSNALTMAAGAGVTILGTNVLGGNTMRLFLGQVTGSAAVSITSCFGLTMQSGL